MFLIRATLSACVIFCLMEPVAGTPDWLDNDGEKYMFVKETKPWQEAQNYCLGQGGTLAEPGDEVEQKWIADKAAELGMRFPWLGFVGAVNKPFGYSDGKHAPLSYTAWGPDEPNNHGENEYCVHLSEYDQLWSDVRCDMEIEFVCKQTGKDCADLFERGVRLSGVYTIVPADQLSSIRVYCDMETDGGGWTVFQRRLDGSVDFYVPWNDYKIGFGNLDGEFWLGNDNIHRLTSKETQHLRIDLEDKYAAYDIFAVSSESDKYQLSLGPYSGTAGDSFTPVHNGMKFSTTDQDNDVYGRRCADMFPGGWWFKDCHISHLNGKYHEDGITEYAKGVNWYSFNEKHQEYSLRRTAMMIRVAVFVPK